MCRNQPFLMDLRKNCCNLVYKCPFINVPSAKDAELAALEDSGVKTYVLVASPTVGFFWRARTLKEKRQPPSCKEGDMIKVGQVIGYLDQFGNELPIRSDVTGEVLRFSTKMEKQ
ncbi:Single hybrid motif-containing protein [Dioscorea alata]|uniref:Single hybrid motif-containing protein n=1 Tax=Dioscorea alata TaxID=55571 RepID=A0ACB7V0D9_DIOAL|nr:Single hybrid motif-containing protein [Dioscorea alata]